MADLQVHARLDHARPRLPLYKLLNADFGIGHDVTLRVFNGDGRMEGDLKAHRIVLALGSSFLERLLFNKSGEMTTVKVVEVKGASLKTAKWMLDFIYFKPTEQCDWDDATAEEIFMLASVADQFEIIELQEKVSLGNEHVIKILFRQRQCCQHSL